LSEQDPSYDSIVQEVRPWFQRLGLPVILVAFDSLKIVFSNSQFEELLGVAETDLVGRLWTVLFEGRAKETLQSIADLYKHQFEMFTPVEHDLAVIRRSGRAVPVICSFSGIVVGGQQFLLVTFYDHSKGVKEKKKIADDLKAVYHMSKLADLGKVAASVAHEMNNPLMVIQGQAELLELRAAKKPLEAAEVRQLVEPIFRSVERMSQIVSQMKNVARTPDGTMTKVDLGKVVAESLLLVQQRLRFLGVNATVDCPEGQWIGGNRTQVEQVLVNILCNAMDAMEESSSETRDIKLRLVPGPDFVTLEVWNSGPPIGKENQEKILNPFFTTKPVGKGTGLGLSVCTGIMRAHKGSLKLKYSNSNGTCFELKFPNLKEAGTFAKMKVLVVDDEQMVRRLIRERLEEEGFDVLTAKNGQEGLEVLINHPDLSIVFTDIKMPIMDGVEFIRQIRSIYPDMLVVVISGFIDSLDEGSVSGSVDEKLAKPFTSRQFRDVLNAVQKKIDGRKKIAAA